MRGRIQALAFLLGGTFLACSSSRPASSPAPEPVSRKAPVAPAGSAPRCEKIEAPKLVRRFEPSYPDDLRKQGVHGTVVMKASLTEEGKLRNIQVSSSPNSRLSELAVEAFQKWQYKPAHCAGKPVQVYITSTMSFDLNK